MPLPAPSAPTERALYVYENVGIQALSVLERTLYEYENKGIQALSVLERVVYEYENRTMQVLSVLERALYLFETFRDALIFPWLMKLDPPQQYPGGAVSLYGDGLGDLQEVGAGATLSASSGSPSALVDRTSTYWQPTDGAASWVRFTFAAAQKLTQIALEGPPASSGLSWGTPLFRFSDGGADVIGSGAPGANNGTTEVPVGTNRTLYTFAARTVTWVEVRVSSGAGQALSEAWIWASDLQAGDSATVYLNAESMGIVSWASRSPYLWPSNTGHDIEAAAVVTVPLDAVSGLLKVEETGSGIP